MNELKLGAVDARFADIVWESSPMSTGELVKRCAEELNWKRPTVYSALRKFCEALAPFIPGKNIMLAHLANLLYNN